jgi:hypothetical protein
MPRPPKQTAEEKRAYQREYALKNKAIIKIKQAKYYLTNQKKALAYAADARANLTDKQLAVVAAKNRLYRTANFEKLKECKKIYNEKNKERVDQVHKDYYIKHRERINIIAAARAKSCGALNVKLLSSKRSDEKANRDFNLTYSYIIVMIAMQNNKCNNCHKEMKLAWHQPSDREQFSINRLNNRLGHIVGNVEITCFGCNMILAGAETTAKSKLKKSLIV